MSVKVLIGDCLDELAQMPDDSIDSIVTDPPYGLSNTAPEQVADTVIRWVNGDREYMPPGKGFMGKEWDAFVPPVAVWDECLRVLKPGGHLLAFAGSRTHDLMTLGIRLAGFDIRDSVAWIHGQGFPKGAAQLKPAFEPVTVARKPFKGTLAANVLEHGTGGLNINECRIESETLLTRKRGITQIGTFLGADGSITPERVGRWPANVVLSEDQAEALDRQSGVTVSHRDASRNGRDEASATFGLGRTRNEARGHNDSGGASRFFYVSKASKRERPSVDGVLHPTVKPLTLMRWLVRLATPPGGIVLDPFAGSGTTIEAALLEGFNSIGIERDAQYVPLIEARIERSDIFGF